MVLSAQIAWSENVETALSSMGGSGDAAPLHSVLSNVEVTLNVLADSVLMEQPPLRRRKLERMRAGGCAGSSGHLVAPSSHVRVGTLSLSPLLCLLSPLSQRQQLHPGGCAVPRGQYRAQQG